MKIDVSEVLMALDGTPLMNEGKEQTLASIAIGALFFMTRDERVAGTEKFKRHQLAQKMYNKEKVDLSIEEIALIKKLIGTAFGPAVVGPAYELLEGGK